MSHNHTFIFCVYNTGSIIYMILNWIRVQPDNLVSIYGQVLGSNLHFEIQRNFQKGGIPCQSNKCQRIITLLGNGQVSKFLFVGKRVSHPRQQSNAILITVYRKSSQLSPLGTYILFVSFVQFHWCRTLLGLKYTGMK